MGAAASAPKSIQTPDVLNFILKEMFSRADLVDIYSLADPNKCSRYLIVTAEALESLFVKMRLYPDKKDGTLYFQSIAGLEKGRSQAAVAAREKQKENCTELAFFFIRIFQTYAALTLSIMDSTIPSVDPVDDIPRAPGARRTSEFLDPKSFLGISKAAELSKPSSWFQFGGSLPQPAGRTDFSGSFFIRDPTIPAPNIRLTAYSILNSVLSQPQGLTRSPLSAPLPFADFPRMTIKQDTLYRFHVVNDPTSREPLPPESMNPLVIYQFERTNISPSKQAIGGRLTITGDPETNNYDIVLGNFQFGTSTVPEQIANKEGSLTPSMDGRVVYDGDSYPNAKGKSLRYLLQEMFEEAIVDKFKKAPFSTVQYLRKMGYISGSPNQDAIINGTHISINAGQESKAKVRITFRDSKILEGDTSKTTIKIDADLEIEEAKETIKNSSNVYKNRVTVDFSNRSINPEYISDMFTFPQIARPRDFISYTKDTTPKSDPGDLTIPQFLESKFQKIISNQDDDIPDRSGIKFTRAGLPEPHNSESMNDDLRVKAIWKALAKDPPVKSHCIARAVQLLSVGAFQRDMGEGAFTSACRLTFRYQKGDDGSLPVPGRPITTEHGIYALATLFVDTLEKGIPKIKDENQYKDFLKNLRYTFEKYPSLEGTPQPNKLNDITERLLPMCKDKDDARLIIDKKANDAGLTSSLRNSVNKLVEIQRNHMGAAMKIIFKLFDGNSIQNKRVFALNPTILRGGTNAVNLVAKEARELLLNYYKGCELTYRDGVIKIYEYNKTLGPEGMPFKLMSSSNTSSTVPKPAQINTVGKTTQAGGVWR